MARFYQTASPEYLQDIMYQPPWEMLMAAGAKKDQDVKNVVDTLEIFNNLPLDFWREADTDRANQVKDYYNSKADEIATMLQSNVFDPNATKNLKNLQRELQRDLESGNIYKLQENAKRYREFEAARQALPNPSDREGYARAVQQYLDSNPEGAYGELFNPGELQGYRDLRNEFAEAYRTQYGEDSFKKVFDNVGGKWIMKNTDAETSKIVGDRFRNWVGSQPDLANYFTTREKYFNEKYYDENGQLVFDQPGYTLSAIDKAAQDLSYRQTVQGREVSQNPYTVMGMQFAHDKEMANLEYNLAKKAQEDAAKGTVNPSSLNVGVVAHKLLNASSALQQQMNKALENVIKPSVGSDGKELPLWKTAEMVLRGGKQKYEALYDEVSKIYDGINKNYTSSRDIYVNTLGQTEADAFFKRIETNSNESMTMYFGKGGQESGDDVMEKPLQLNKISSVRGQRVDPTKTRIVKENTLPIHLQTGDIKDDYIRYMVEFQPISVDARGKVTELPVQYEAMYKDASYFLNNSMDKPELK